MEKIDIRNRIEELALENIMMVNANDLKKGQCDFRLSGI